MSEKIKNSKWGKIIKRLDEYRFEIPSSYKNDMNTDCLVFSTDDLLELIINDESLIQASNVASLPGIVGKVAVMPDIHQGYGAPIGTVSAFDLKEGIVSPGMVGYDINCGIRLLKTDLNYGELKNKMPGLIDELFRTVPTGVGKGGQIKLSRSDMKKVLEKGVKWVIEQGYGRQEDLKNIENNGVLKQAMASDVSDRARSRGMAQLGTLGSGNHFLEILKVSEIFDKEIANSFGLYDKQIVVLIHSGSRGLGHQVCTDYVKVMKEAMNKYNISISDRQLGCTPISSIEGESYLSAMACAANFGWANRQCLTHWTRSIFSKMFGSDGRLGLVYDVAHNIAKFEDHIINGEKKKVLVHRKGATRAFPASHPELPEHYKQTGQPVLIPGDMGRYSYVLVGTQGAALESFSSTCHGAGRKMSRKQAKKGLNYKEVEQKLKSQGIIVKSGSKAGLLEETSEAYKDVKDVVDVVDRAGIAKKVAKLRPLGVIKG